jgi:hypothetical protein
MRKANKVYRDRDGVMQLVKLSKTGVVKVTAILSEQRKGESVKEFKERTRVH